MSKEAIETLKNNSERHKEQYKNVGAIKYENDLGKARAEVRDLRKSLSKDQKLEVKRYSICFPPLITLCFCTRTFCLPSCFSGTRCFLAMTPRSTLRTEEHFARSARLGSTRAFTGSRRY